MLDFCLYVISEEGAQQHPNMSNEVFIFQKIIMNLRIIYIYLIIH